MVLCIEMVIVDVIVIIDEVMFLFFNCGVFWMLVVDDEVDDVVGVLYLKDFV